MDGEAGWWTTSGNIGLHPLARVMGVGRQQEQLQKIENSVYGSILGEAHYSSNVRNRCIAGEENSYKWENKLYQKNQKPINRIYMKDINTNFKDTRLKSKEYLKQFMIKWD